MRFPFLKAHITLEQTRKEQKDGMMAYFREVNRSLERSRDGHLLAKRRLLLAEQQLLGAEQLLLLAEQRLLMNEEQQKALSGDQTFIFHDPDTDQHKLEDKSGIVYIEDAYKIKVAGENFSNVGLLQKNKDGFLDLRNDIPTLDLSQTLNDAWFITKIENSKAAFLDELLKKVPALAIDFVRNAWHALNDSFQMKTRNPPPGEMSFQQIVCTPFAKLLMAAAGKHGFSSSCYKANEEVCSSSAIKKCIEKEDYNKVLLPFIIVTGSRASLYVTGLDVEGNPKVYIVGYPIEGNTDNLTRENSRSKDISKSPSDERTKLFVTFAVLLNDFKTFFNTSVKPTYKKQIKLRCDSLRKFRKGYTPTARTRGSSKSNQAKENSDGKTGGNLGMAHKQSAKEAATNGGMFTDLENPFEQFYRLTGRRTSTQDAGQAFSRFYFKGRLSSTLGISQEVFIKVWRTDSGEVDIASVESEWMYHNGAFKAGVPVAAPVLSELVRSTSSRGFEYVLFAMEFIQQSYINSICDLWAFCISLIQTVLMLHQNAKMLHCDLKPDNLRWNKGVVKLIDFEHAQDIENAGWAPGTDGYQAPEIMNNMACTEQTEAFSVGRIISRKLEAFRSGKLRRQKKELADILLDVSVKLTSFDSRQRWSLSDALRAMQSNQWPHSPQVTDCEAHPVFNSNRQPPILVSPLVPP